MTNLKSIITIAFLLFGLNLFAQENGAIKGKVIDKITKQAIPFASIKIINTTNIGDRTRWIVEIFSDKEICLAHDLFGLLSTVQLDSANLIQYIGAWFVEENSNLKKDAIAKIATLSAESKAAFRRDALDQLGPIAVSVRFISESVNFLLGNYYATDNDSIFTNL